jgi:pyruvate-formate lyase
MRIQEVKSQKEMVEPGLYLVDASETQSLELWSKLGDIQHFLYSFTDTHKEMVEMWNRHYDKPVNVAQEAGINPSEPPTTPEHMLPESTVIKLMVASKLNGELSSAAAVELLKGG